MSVETAVTLIDVISKISEVIDIIKDFKDTIPIGSSGSNSDITNDLVVGVSNINTQLIDVNIHLGNIDALGKLILQFMIIIVVFKVLYFLVDKVFFNGC